MSFLKDKTLNINGVTCNLGNAVLNLFLRTDRWISGLQFNIASRT
jgi:hypothetical protein